MKYLTYNKMEKEQDQLNTNISTHEIQIDDYSEIYELWGNTSGMGLSDADTHENIYKFLLRNKGLSFVCRHVDKIIGTILCGHDGRRGYIYHVTVAEKYRGRGIGLMLVDKSLQALKEEGISKCHLFVFSDNVVGNAFWNAKGWTKREDIFVYSKSI
ncbi:MAG TPA: GNAT family N-acetyltransferase [Clostridiales bacterium]|nr:GNAT family N-acetyltransferase [Clostridiales bacterium]